MSLKRKQNKKNLQQSSMILLQSKTKLYLQKSQLQLKNLLPQKSLKLLQKLKIRLHSQKTFVLKTISSQLQVTNKTQRSRQKVQRSPDQPVAGDLPVQTVDDLALHHSFTPLPPIKKTIQLIVTNPGPFFSLDLEEEEKHNGGIKRNPKQLRIKSHPRSYSCMNPKKPDWNNHTTIYSICIL